MRKRSLSLFQQVHNSPTCKLEGVAESDNEDFELKVDDDYAENLEEFALSENVTNAKENKTNQLKRDVELIKALKLAANDKDKRSYKNTLRNLKFSNVDGLKSMNENELRAKFNALLKPIGRFRTFYSVVHDMEIFYTEAIKRENQSKMPIPPLHARSIYLKELLANGKSPPANQNLFKWSSDLYKNLSVENKSHYIKKREKMMEKYTRQLEDFYQKHPNERPVKKLTYTTKQITPFNLYFVELKSVDKNCKRAAALEQWKKLSVKNKIGYIKKAYQYEQDEANDDKKVAISIKEKMLLEEHNGKPEKPPLTLYGLYMQVKDQPFSYKSLTNKEKHQLQNKLNGLVRKYEEDMTVYIQQLKGKAKKTEQEGLLKFLSKFKLPKTVIENSYRPNLRLKRSSSVSVQYIDSDSDVAGKSVSNKKKKSSEFEVAVSKDIKPAYQTVVKKKEKNKTKEIIQNDDKKKPEVKEFLEIKPPKTVFKYFASINSFDSLVTAKKKYRTLSILKKRNIKNSYKLVCETYISKFRQYLSTLNETEIVAYVKQIEHNKSLENNSDDEMISSEDESSNNSDSE